MFVCVLGVHGCFCEHGAGGHGKAKQLCFGRCTRAANGDTIVVCPTHCLNHTPHYSPLLRANINAFEKNFRKIRIVLALIDIMSFGDARAPLRFNCD